MIKKICLFLLFAVLFFPLLEQYFSFNERQWKIKTPDGHFPKVNAPIWSWEAWNSGEFQSQTSDYLKRNMSVRPLFYRFSNQWHYSLLKEIRARRVVEGKEGYLFELGYIEALIKSDLLPIQEIEANVQKLKFIQTELKERYQTELLVVVAPSKASYYPEYIPDQFQSTNTFLANGSAYKQFFQNYQIPYIDFDSYFIKQKESSPYPLFSKLGTHWSLYGGMIAADSMLHKMSEILDKNIARLDLTKPLKVTNKPEGTDDDIGKGLNLLQKLESDTLAYFQHIFAIDSSHYKPKVILLGDSFTHTIWNANIPHQYFDPAGSQFWYYFNEVYAINSDAHGKSTTDIDWFAYVKNADMIILLYTPNTIKGFGSGFLGVATDALKK